MNAGELKMEKNISFFLFPILFIEKKSLVKHLPIFTCYI